MTKRNRNIRYSNPLQAAFFRHPLGHEANFHALFHGGGEPRNPVPPVTKIRIG
jgi:hypothetical protein